MKQICLRILHSGDLDAKLDPGAGAVEPLRSGPPRAPLRPARAPALAMRAGADRLPRPAELGDAGARARCLARFAHHELMAVELFAWALLRWPGLPEAMQRGLLGILREEQLHCRLYLGRLAAHGSELSEHALSDYFWKHVPAISSSPAGPAAFLAAMGLTLEQANLDFAPLYRDAFREAGDEESARVCERVHRDEIGHVRFAAIWLQALAAGGARGPRHDGGAPPPCREHYEAAIPFPLSASRAKGRRFEAGARREAGLPEDFIEYVRRARSPQELRPQSGSRSAGAAARRASESGS